MVEPAIEGTLSSSLICPAIGAVVLHTFSEQLAQIPKATVPLLDGGQWLVCLLATKCCAERVTQNIEICVQYQRQEVLQPDRFRLGNSALYPVIASFSSLDLPDCCGLHQTLCFEYHGLIVLVHVAVPEDLFFQTAVFSGWNEQSMYCMPSVTIHVPAPLLRCH